MDASRGSISGGILSGPEFCVGGKVGRLDRRFSIVRGRGLGDKLREVLRMTCSDFRDVHPGHGHNYCCNAGGGLINCGPPWTATRVVGNRVKAEQLAETGADYVVTPCHNCHSGIEQIIKGHKLSLHVLFISEILVALWLIVKGFNTPESKSK